MLLEPHATFPEHVAVIRRKDNDRVVPLPDPLQRLDQLADQLVEIADRPVVRAARGSDVLVGKVNIQHAEVGQQTNSVGIVLLF